MTLGIPPPGLTDTKWVRDGHFISWFLDDYEELDLHLEHPETCPHDREDLGGAMALIHYHCIAESALEGEGFQELLANDEDAPWDKAKVGDHGQVEIEHRGHYGWSRGTPDIPSEYEFEWYWRPIVEGRDEELADQD